MDNNREEFDSGESSGRSEFLEISDLTCGCPPGQHDKLTCEDMSDDSSISIPSGKMRNIEKRHQLEQYRLFREALAEAKAEADAAIEELVNSLVRKDPEQGGQADESDNDFVKEESIETEYEDDEDPEDEEDCDDDDAEEPASEEMEFDETDDPEPEIASLESVASLQSAPSVWSASLPGSSTAPDSFPDSATGSGASSSLDHKNKPTPEQVMSMLEKDRGLVPIPEEVIQDLRRCIADLRAEMRRGRRFASSPASHDWNRDILRYLEGNLRHAVNANMRGDSDNIKRLKVKRGKLQRVSAKHGNILRVNVKHGKIQRVNVKRPNVKRPNVKREKL